MGYDDLVIGDGQTAAVRYALALESVDPRARQDTFDALGRLLCARHARAGEACVQRLRRSVGPLPVEPSSRERPFTLRLALTPM